jgi:type IV pilus assembly protein PilB
MAERLGQIAIKKGLITRDQLREALICQRSGDNALGLAPGEKLGRILLAKGLIKPMVLVRLLYEQMGKIDFLYISDYMVEPRVVTWVTEELAEKHSILPLVSMGEDTLMVAVARGLQPNEIKELEASSKRKIEEVPVDDSDILTAIRQCYKTFRERGIMGVRIGEILVRDNYINQDDLDEALKTSAKTQRRLGKVLVEKGKVNERDFFYYLSLQKKLPLVLAQDILPILDKSLVRGISKAFCLSNLIAPYLREGDKVYLATAEPTINPDELKKALKCKVIDLRLATYSDIEMILRALFIERESESMEDLLVGVQELESIPIEEELSPVSIEDIHAFTRRYQKLTDHVLMEAIRKRASDIHIENYEKSVVVRFRIDGILYDMEYLQIKKKNVGGVVNVLKIQSNMNIAERRLPQSGRFRKKTGKNQTYDFRLQSQPTLYGENIIIRILGQSGPLLGIDELGFSPDVKVRYEKLITNPSGLILITGPTGSGKTTTLNSTLDALRKDLRKKIITIEDPVEYSIGRIQQSQVKEEIGYSFAKAARAFLREDPDVLLIGEIRDRETALEVMRASQTGHLVFSTLHTSNSIESIQRLLDLDLTPGSIAAELLAIISQRLARQNCPDCKKTCRPSKDLLDAFYPGGVPEGLQFYKSGGCEQCNYTGFKGRVAVLEFWFIDMDSKRQILEKANFEDLYAGATAGGMMPMIKDALMKVETGLIPLDELPDIIPHFEIIRWKGEERPAMTPYR